MKDIQKLGLAVGVSLLLGFGSGFLIKGTVDKKSGEPTAFGLVDKALFAPLIPLAVLPKVINFSTDLPWVKTTQTDKEIIVNAQIPGLKDGEVDLIVGKDLLTITKMRRKASLFRAGMKGATASTVSQEFVVVEYIA